MYNVLFVWYFSCALFNTFLQILCTREIRCEQREAAESFQRIYDSANWRRVATFLSIYSSGEKGALNRGTSIYRSRSMQTGDNYSPESISGGIDFVDVHDEKSAQWKFLRVQHCAIAAASSNPVASSHEESDRTRLPRRDPRRKSAIRKHSRRRPVVHRWPTYIHAVIRLKKTDSWKWLCKAAFESQIRIIPLACPHRPVGHARGHALHGHKGPCPSSLSLMIRIESTDFRNMRSLPPPRGLCTKEAGIIAILHDLPLLGKYNSR